MSANSAPIQYDEITFIHVGDTCPNLTYSPCGLMTEKKRKFVVNCAFAIVKVGVAYAACLNIDYHFSGPRVWYLNGFDGHRSAF